MSLNDTDPPRLGDRASRRAFLAGGLVAAVAVASHGGSAMARAADASCCPTRLTTLEAAPPFAPTSAVTAGNQQAMALARRSTLVMETNEAIMAMAEALPIIARVDPVQAGLLQPSADAFAPAGLGLAQVPPRIEPHINHLSDHDFVFTGHSLTTVLNTLRDLAPTYGIDPPSQTARFNLFRNTVLSQLSDMRLYGYLQTGGADAVKARIDSLDLSALR